MRDGQPPPESAAEKIKKQILKVGDGLVSVLRSFPSLRAKSELTSAQFL